MLRPKIRLGRIPSEVDIPLLSFSQQSGSEGLWQRQRWGEGPSGRSIMPRLGTMARFNVIAALFMCAAVAVVLHSQITARVALASKKVGVAAGARLEKYGGIVAHRIFDGIHAELAGGSSASAALPSMSQVLKVRRKETMLRRQEAAHASKLEHAKLNNCHGKSLAGCDMDLDAVELQRFLKQKHAREAELLQVASTPREPGMGALKSEEARLVARNKEERKIHDLLLANAKLESENQALLSSKRGEGVAASVPRGGVHSGKQLAVAVDETTQGNPGGVLEDVPATVLAKPAGPHDWDGVEAVPARIPDIGFGPSLLDSDGVEQRGSFTARKSSPYGGLLLRVYGKINHDIVCTLRGYRRINSDGQELSKETVFTGYKREWEGKTTIMSGVIPPSQDNFDLVTCRDKDTGEVQHFRMNPRPSL
jgi:hypothetical protein